MIKTVKIEFNEQSKGVVSSVKIETQGENLDNSLLLDEAKRLYEEASLYSLLKTREKSRQ